MPTYKIVAAFYFLLYALRPHRSNIVSIFLICHVILVYIYIYFKSNSQLQLKNPAAVAIIQTSMWKSSARLSQQQAYGVLVLERYMGKNAMLHFPSGIVKKGRALRERIQKHSRSKCVCDWNALGLVQCEVQLGKSPCLQTKECTIFKSSSKRLSISK